MPPEFRDSSREFHQHLESLMAQGVLDAYGIRIFFAPVDVEASSTDLEQASVFADVLARLGVWSRWNIRIWSVSTETKPIQLVFWGHTF